MMTRRFTLCSATLLLIAVAGLMLAGCPIPAANQNPVANAGSDQSVGFGDAATLDGSASTDPDGDTLTYSWSQTGGTNTVTLTGANTATATFTAPSSVDTLQFQLTVNDGRGGANTDSVTVSVTDTTPAPPPTNPVLLIANYSPAANNIVGYDISDPQNVNGNIAPDANLAGASTLLSRPSDIVVDAGGALLVSNFDFATPSITSYPNAVDLTGINGNVAPDRNVQGAATELVQPTTLAVNTTADLVFVADMGANRIFVYGNASTAAFNGNLAPLRTIASGDLNNPFGINFGANDNLYVANHGNNDVIVFANASNQNGTVAATRIITSAAFTNLYDVFIDGGDTMYVVDATGYVFTFNNASALNGLASPNFTLQVQGATFLTAIAVDSAGNGYVVDSIGNAVYGYDDIATQNGLLPPDRTLQGGLTQLNTPIRVFLLE